MEDIRQTREWGKYLQSCNWIVEKVGGVNVFIKKVPLTPFSMMKIQRFHGKLDFIDLKKVKRKYKIVYTVVEPAVLQRAGGSELSYTSLRTAESSEPSFAINRNPFLPTKSIVIDLTRSKKQLWNDLSSNAKRILNNKNIVQTTKIRNRKKFYKAWKGASKTWVMSEKSFKKLLNAYGKKASLWVSESKGELLSGILLLESKDMANYFQTWTSEEGRKKGAHYHLVWKVILECKKKGLKWFDFEGILDERWPQKKWAGFSEFKKKFGGKVVSYPGSFTEWL